MKSVRCLPIALSLLIAFAAAGWAETVTDEELAKSILEASILPKGWSVVAKTNGKEVVVSTFRAPDANTTDCKIDASMIAKNLMIDHDFGISRVRVQFHEPAGTSSVYQQVSVSLAEVKAFAAGAVTKEQFLDSLDVEKLKEVQKAPAKAEEKKPDATKASEKPKAPESITVVSRRVGLSFKVPSGWVAQELSSGPVILRLTPQHTKMAGIELSFEPDSATPAAKAKLQRRKFTYPGTSLAQYFESTNFGTGPYPGSLVVVTYPHESNVPYYDMNLYFGNNYKVWAWCDVPSYPVAGPAFDQILRTMTFAAKKKTK